MILYNNQYILQNIEFKQNIDIKINLQWHLTLYQKSFQIYEISS